MNRRRFLQLSAAAVGGVALGGCDVPLVGGGGPDRSGLRRLVGLSVYADDAWTRCVASGVADALRGSGYELLARRADRSASRELTNLQSFANRKVAGAVVVPVSVESATRGAQAIQQGGGAVVSALSPGEGGAGDKYYAGLVEPLTEDDGRRIGEWLGTRLPGGGQLVVVQGLLGQGVSERLDRGLQEGLAPAGGLRIVARGPGNLVASDAVAVVRGALARHPGVNAIVDYGAEMGAGIGAYLDDQGRRDITHVSVGAIDATRRWLGTPALAATLYFSASRLGQAAGRMLLEVLREGEAAADPLSRRVPAALTARLGADNCFGPAVRIQAPVHEDSTAPLPPTETEAGDLGE